jgi:hypothetical protein
MVVLERESMFTRRVNKMELPLTPEAFEAAYNAWKSGTLIQTAFSTLNAEQREFIKTGVTPEEWNSIFGEE